MYPRRFPPDNPSLQFRDAACPCHVRWNVAWMFPRHGFRNGSEVGSSTKRNRFASQQLDDMAHILVESFCMASASNLRVSEQGAGSLSMDLKRFDPVEAQVQGVERRLRFIFQEMSGSTSLGQASQVACPTRLVDQLPHCF